MYHCYKRLPKQQYTSLKLIVGSQKWIPSSGTERRSCYNQNSKELLIFTRLKSTCNDVKSDLSMNRVKSSRNTPLDFEDFEKAFRAKTTGEIVRALMVYKLCSYDTLVERNKTVSTGQYFIKLYIGRYIYIYYILVIIIWYVLISITRVSGKY